MSEPHFTVLIPTRERCATLAATIRTCLAQDYSNVEFVVSDNVSTDNTRDVVNAFRDERLRYVQPPRRLSMTGNFEFALSHAKPGFVVSFGDDDGLMPNGLRRAAEIISETGVKAVADTPASYWWPNSPTPDWNNTIIIRDLRKGFSILDADIELRNRVKFDGHERFYIDKLPSLYRGFISTGIINAAKRNGKYFNSVTPDAYSAIVNCALLKTYALSHEPITIEGVSAFGNGAAQMLNTASAAEEQRYLSENDIPYHEHMVYAPTPPIIFAEAYLQARSHFPEAFASHDFRISRVCRAGQKAANGPKKKEIELAVKKLLQMHALSGPENTNFTEDLKLKWEIFSSSFNMLEIKCQDWDISNVYEASFLARDILKSKQGGRVLAGRSLVFDKAKRALRRCFAS